MDTQKILQKHLEIRFGSRAIQSGFASKDQILKALEIQLDEDLSNGYHRSIGQILVDTGLITPEQRESILHGFS